MIHKLSVFHKNISIFLPFLTSVHPFITETALSNKLFEAQCEWLSLVFTFLVPKNRVCGTLRWEWMQSIDWVHFCDWFACVSHRNFHFHRKCYVAIAISSVNRLRIWALVYYLIFVFELEKKGVDGFCIVMGADNGSWSRWKRRHENEWKVWIVAMKWYINPYLIFTCLSTIHKRTNKHKRMCGQTMCSRRNHICESPFCMLHWPAPLRWMTNGMATKSTKYVIQLSWKWSTVACVERKIYIYANCIEATTVERCASDTHIKLVLLIFFYWKPWSVAIDSNRQEPILDLWNFGTLFFRGISIRQLNVRWRTKGKNHLHFHWSKSTFYPISRSMITTHFSKKATKANKREPVVRQRRQRRRRRSACQPMFE